MIDPRFYDSLGPIPLGDLVRLSGSELADPGLGDLPISNCSPLDEAGPGDMAFCEKWKGDGPIVTRAAACWVRTAHLGRLPDGVAAIVSRTPRGSFAVAATTLFAVRTHSGECGPIHPAAALAEGVLLSPGVIIGPDATVGSGTRIGPGTVIGPGVVIGENCQIGANVTILCSVIGNRVKIASGTVIGEAGFGVAGTARGPVDVPQFGRVLLHDDVSVGSLCAVDRGAFGDTVIGQASKIDNFTQIAHNVQLGRGVIIAAFGGISGSTVVGDFVQMGGRVGIADHLTIGAQARIGAGSGVRKNIPAGETWVGYPAKPRSRFVEELVAVGRAADALQDPKDSRLSNDQS